MYSYHPVLRTPLLPEGGEAMRANLYRIPLIYVQRVHRLHLNLNNYESATYGETKRKIQHRLSFTSQKFVFTTFIGKKVNRNQSLVKNLSIKNRDKTIKSQSEAGYDRTYSPNVLGI